MSRAQPNIWPLCQIPRTLPPSECAPAQDVVAFIQYHANTIANMPAHERWKLREMSVLSMMQVMRDCPDRKIRREAFQVLVRLGVVRAC